MLGATGVELPKMVKISNPKLGVAKLILMTVAISWYVIYQQVYVDKGYLAIAPIFGTTRLQLQHPVKHCNPMDEDCEADFTPAEELPYCKQNPHASVGRPGKCEFLDVFDIEKGGIQTTQLLVPTRLRELVQADLCNNYTTACKKRFHLEKDETVFVADAERFTLLIDHSFICKELNLSHNAWDMLGFIRPCGYPYNCQLVPIDVLPHFADKNPTSQTDQDSLRNVWRAGPSAKLSDSFSIPNGDVFRVGYIMSLLGKELDAPYGFENHTVREEGLSVIVEIRYSNYVPHSIPNQLPAVYEYRFSLSASETYKFTDTVGLPGERKRVVNDHHGLYFTTRQRGTLGKFSLRSTLLMLLETSLILGVVRWAVNLATLNWWQGRAGDDLEEKLAQEVEFKMWDGEAGEGDGPTMLRSHTMMQMKRTSAGRAGNPEPATFQPLMQSA